MQFYAHHGWYEAERKIGQLFTVDLCCKIDSMAGSKDDIQRTIDYQQLYDFIRIKMQQRHQLLESLLDEIGDALISEFPMLLEVSLTIHKQPQLGGRFINVQVSKSFFP